MVALKHDAHVRVEKHEFGSRNAVVALKRIKRLRTVESNVWKQERRGGIETRKGRRAATGPTRKQERRGGIET